MLSVLLSHFPPYIFRQFLTDMKHADSAGRAIQQAPGSSHICLPSAGITDVRLILLHLGNSYLPFPALPKISPLESSPISSQLSSIDSSLAPTGP